MSLTINEVRVPTPSRRARKILAALNVAGDINEYSAAGAIAITDGVALLAPTSAAMAMSLANSGMSAGSDIIRLEMIRQSVSTYTAVVTPATFADGTTLTFDAVGEYAVLIWNGTAWESKVATATIA